MSHMQKQKINNVYCENNTYNGNEAAGEVRVDNASWIQVRIGPRYGELDFGQQETVVEICNTTQFPFSIA